MADKTFKGKISAQGREITVLSVGTADDFISLTDIAKYKRKYNWGQTYTIDICSNQKVCRIDGS